MGGGWTSPPWATVFEGGWTVPPVGDPTAPEPIVGHDILSETGTPQTLAGTKKALKRRGIKTTTREEQEAIRREAKEKHRKKKEAEAEARDEATLRDETRRARAFGRQGTLLTSPIGAVGDEVAPGAKTLLGV